MAAEFKESGAVNTVTITTEEYMRLVERANVNWAFNERLNCLEERFSGLERNVMNLDSDFYRFKAEVER